jgi:hypothetical protein
MPPAAYQGRALDVDQPFYRRLAAEDGRRLIASFAVPIRSGRAWHVPRGHLCRLRTLDGPQVGDRPGPSETFRQHVLAAFDRPQGTG